jgi:hypothetical protein
VVLSEGMRRGLIISWRGDFVMGRAWFEVLVVFGVVLGQLNVLAGEESGCGRCPATS